MVTKEKDGMTDVDPLGDILCSARSQLFPIQKSKKGWRISSVGDGREAEESCSDSLSFLIRLLPCCMATMCVLDK